MFRLPISVSAPILTGWALAALSLVSFAWLSEEMMENDTALFDTHVRNLVQTESQPLLTRAMVLVSDAGSPLSVGLLTLAGCALFWTLQKRRDAAFLALSVAGGSLLSSVLKLSFHRPRPVPFYGLPAPASYSFPSGHALVSLCFLCMLAYIVNRHLRSISLRTAIMAIAVLLSLTVGYSRIYLGVHYPSDVLAGFAAGAVWCVAMMAAFRKA